MIIENLYQPFEIEYKEVDECPIMAHKHNFFELVYVLDGTGTQCINNNNFDYHDGHMFLLMPQDCHSFEISSTSKFFFIRFNNIYIEAHKLQSRQHGLHDWIQKLEFIFQNNSHMPGCILKNKTDKVLVKSLIEAIIREQINQQPHHRELIQQIVNTLITVVVRNLLMQIKPKKSEEGSPSMGIVQYIHEHIYSPEKLKAAQIAAHFNMSQSYVSEYFKKHSGESLQEYIINYKLRLVETRLQYSDMRMSEIAQELNFSDESHLNRIFKKYRGTSPSGFRKSLSKIEN